jgi:hypothetical protein
VIILCARDDPNELSPDLAHGNKAYMKSWNQKSGDKLLSEAYCDHCQVYTNTFHRMHSLIDQKKNFVLCEKCAKSRKDYLETFLCRIESKRENQRGR